jgi:hypothetical protein
MNLKCNGNYKRIEDEQEGHLQSLYFGLILVGRLNLVFCSLVYVLQQHGRRSSSRYFLEGENF